MNIKPIKFPKLVLNVFLILMVYGGFCASTDAKTYYVAPNGSNSNDGASNEPFETISHAAGIVNPGDTVIVRDGLYTMNSTIKFTRSGTSTKWITFKSENKWGAEFKGKGNGSRGNGLEYGWDFRANFIRVEGFEIHNTYDTGINLHNSNNILIKNNYIHHIARFCDQSANGSAGILVGDTFNITFDGNVLDMIGRYHNGENGCTNSNHYWQNHDQGFYINRSRDFTIINNVFTRIRSGWAVDIDRGTDRTLISNNTFAFHNPNREGYILIWAGGNGDDLSEEVIIQNNIFYNPNGAAIRAAKPQKNHIVRNNLIIGSNNLLSLADGASQSAFSTSNNIFTDDPLFVDVSNDDFHLKNTNSPAVDAGIGSFPYFFSHTPSPHLLDHDGNQRPHNGVYDIGAFEYDGAPPPPPPPTGCGNGTLEAGEECDDGNSDDGDGCSSSCQIEQSSDFPVNLLGSAPEEKTVMITVNKPADALEAQITLTVYDADFPNEGELYVNGQGPIILFESVGENVPNHQVDDLTFDTPASWWVNGSNSLRFLHLETEGYRVDAVSVQMTTDSDFKPPKAPVNLRIGPQGF
jgi:cysteine-rich repeat protein